MLPSVVPNSRIMVYNYDSRWHADAPRTRLQICGEELVHNLHAFRKRQRDRPVVFIGHSLGGLVIQHALLFADREEEFRYLPRRTNGFVALGSPFRGTKMHGIAKFAAKSMYLAGSYHGLLETLSYDNEILRDKLQEFCRLRDSMSFLTCCFFEAYETDYGARFGLRGLIRRMVQESACITGWERAQLQTDHMKLNKFSGPRDRSFLSVSAKVLTMCSKSQNVVEHQTKTVVEHQTEPAKGHWMVPFERNEAFVGREEVLRFLFDRIPPGANGDACQRTAVEGLGGVGKTQIALEAAFRLRHTHPSCSVFWVPTIDATTFEKAYHKIGRLLGVSGIDEAQANVKALVKSALSQVDAGQWLLIIDNADDPMLMSGPKGLSTYFPSSMNGSLLLTTRTREVAVRLDIHTAGIVSTTKMSRGEATQMIEARLTDCQIQDTASTTGLLDLLADLPLAIKQASTFMHMTGMTTARYLEHFRSSDTISVNLLSQDFEDRGRYDTVKNPVATTWLISFEHISRDCPKAGEYLRFMCFLAERDIPLSLLPLANDEIEAEKALGALAAYGFITRRKDGLSIDMHRLVRLAMRNWLLKEGQEQQEYTGVIQRVQELFPFPVHENREVWVKYIAHAQSALESEVECGADEATVVLLSKVGIGFFGLGSYQYAGPLFQRSVELSENVFGKENMSTLSCMSNLAVNLDSQGQYGEAAKVKKETLELMEKVLGKEHPDILASIGNLAQTLAGQGNYIEAAKIQRETLELREKVLGKEHPSTLASMRNLAQNLVGQGKYREAAKIQKETLELMEKVLGKEHPHTLAANRNLEYLLTRIGHEEERMELVNGL
ncbi:hypothetical protein B0J13DRAFT_452805 [Dactylonectria estremocensis]|uniref:AB hydrolase-1 domain-containing protein n=1 Tax=Dactylonectria estremocensis TaxID=1079267 RepID=A0A9P9ISE1_9HYPO|nr:hypothetical protein B0J13DRAFT_452805 [Dactylonectria estremocensis]